MQSLSDGEKLAASVQKTTNRVTLQDLEAKVVAVEYLNPLLAPHLTLCTLLLNNGYCVVGQSAPADPANHNVEAGRKFARDDALRKIWPLEGYLLCDRLKSQPEQNA